MTICLCDDEKKERDGMRAILGAYAQEADLGFDIDEYPNGEALLAAMRSGKKFDILFLDIYMGDDDGVAIAREIRKTDQECHIVFATSSRERAIEGYGVRALQYLVKPVTAESVAGALDLALGTMPAADAKSVRVQNRQGVFRLPLADIIYAESNARVVTVTLRDREPVGFYGKLDDFERECADGRFLRIHKSYLVNLDYVRSIVNGYMLLETGAELRFSINATQAKERFASHTAGKL
jgi:DNA-binding LytR/AlgR family response regulator